MPTPTVSDYERERGKPMPSKLHSVVQTNLLVLLARYRPEMQVLSELTLRLGDRDLTPDLCLYRDLDVDFSRDETQVTDPPLLAVEIASPTQGIQALVDKAQFLLDHGVASCWVVQPQLRTVTIFTPETEPTTYSEGTVTDPATDVEVELASIFSAGGES
jgi:Uma2 family endonuclease